MALSSAGQAQLPWKVIETRVIGKDLDMDGLGPVVLAADGGLYVLNFVTSEILRLDSAGRLLWRAGRRGQGPGEFAQAYRLAERPHGGVVVYDMGTNKVVAFDQKGSFAWQRSLNRPGFSQVDDIIETPGGEIVISGVAGAERSGATAPKRGAVHVFDAQMDLVRSYGPLPLTKDTSNYTLRFWGAGHLTLGSDGTLWFARKLPYELYQFRTDGTLLRTLRMPAVIADPADFMEHERIASEGRVRVRHRMSGRDVARPARVVELGPTLLLTGLQRKQGTTMDVVSRSGSRIGSAERPTDWVSVVGFDVSRSVLWAMARIDDVPVLVRQRISLNP